MKKKRQSRQVALVDQIQRLTRDLEELVPELREALSDQPLTRPLLASSARSLERAASAVRLVVDEKGEEAGAEFRALFEGTSPLLSLIGSRVVLSADRKVPPAPSTGAQALALLMEQPGRAFEARDIAERLGVSIPIARTTLNRLVQSGHAVRPSAGRFKLKA